MAVGGFANMLFTGLEKAENLRHLLEDHRIQSEALHIKLISVLSIQHCMCVGLSQCLILGLSLGNHSKRCVAHESATCCCCVFVETGQ